MDSTSSPRRNREDHEGPTLEVENQSGSESPSTSPQIQRSLTESSATSSAEESVLTVVQAVRKSKEEVHEDFRDLTSEEEFLFTLNEVLELVDSGTEGGVILLIIDKAHKDELLGNSVDGGALKDVCRQYGRKVCHPSFKEILYCFCQHSDSDRWCESHLTYLRDNLQHQYDPSELCSVEHLKGQPKDGAFIISHSGRILGAAYRLAHSASHLRMVKVDGTNVGTRHAAALGAAEWMRTEGIDGAVFVKSDSGDVHVMIPNPNENLPLVVALSPSVDG